MRYVGLVIDKSAYDTLSAGLVEKFNICFTYSIRQVKQPAFFDSGCVFFESLEQNKENQGRIDHGIII